MSSGGGEVFAARELCPGQGGARYTLARWGQVLNK